MLILLLNIIKKDVDPQSKSKSVDKLSVEEKKLIIIYKKNFHHTQELQK